MCSHNKQGVIHIVANYLLGEITPSYILHTRALGTYLLGVFILQKIL
jgi:hypothetical protein